MSLVVKLTSYVVPMIMAFLRKRGHVPVISVKGQGESAHGFVLLALLMDLSMTLKVGG